MDPVFLGHLDRKKMDRIRNTAVYRHHQQGETEYKHRTQDKKPVTVGFDKWQYQVDYRFTLG